VNAADDDDVGVGLRGLHRQSERIPDDIGDGIEDFGYLVVMSQDDGVAFALETVDRRHVGSVHGPLDARNDALDAGEDRIGLSRDAASVR
jgi:hypothetical protein